METRALIQTLVVADADVEFERETSFSLTHVLSVLRQSREPRFEIRTAIRNAGRELFTDELLRGVHVLWLFGKSRERDINAFRYKLTTAELRAVTSFMNRGGGVFATGDHEDLGVNLCGQIPRVRSMRKWFWEEPLPPLQPRAPIGTLRSIPPEARLAERHDTLAPTGADDFRFQDESDVIPQRIAVKQYAAAGLTVPHPILGGPHGTIDVLPDHAHEGECLVPDRIDERRYDFGGLKGDEYPRAGSSGPRVLPEVIASATIFEHVTSYFCSPEYKPKTTRVRSFGVIGAYNGDRAGVGRVVVDATWHHFFDINLTGRAKPGMYDDMRCRPANDPRRFGFKAPAADPRVLRQIDAYFVNIGWWLAPRAVRFEAAVALLEDARREYPLYEELPPVIDDFDAELAARAGELARLALGGMELILLQTLLDEAGEAALNAWDAAAEAEAEPASPSAFIHYERAVDVVIGGAILGLAREREPDAAAADGAVQGVRDALALLPGAIATAAAAFAAPFAR